MKSPIPPSFFLIINVIFSAHAQLVTSDIRIRCDGAPPSEIGTFISTSSLGALSDQRSAIGDGTSAQSKTTTSGISYITLPEHPGKVFVATGSFRGTISSSATLPNGGLAIPSANLNRLGRWRLQALKPELVGTSGTFRATFLVSWNVQSQNSSHRTAVYIQTTGLPSFVADIQGNASGADTKLHSSPNFSFAFNSGFPCSWGMETAVTSSYYLPSASASNASEVQLWNVDVFDSNNVLLVRYVDYEWYEERSTSEVYPVAAGAISGPAISIHKTDTGNLRITFNGILQQCDDLGLWLDVQPQPPSEFELHPPFNIRRFYRAITP